MIKVPERAVSSLEETSVFSTAISSEQAIANASGYLAEYVSTLFGAEEPILLQLDRLTWQVLVYFKQPLMMPFKAAFLDVDAGTGEIVTPFTDEQIETLLNRADAYAKLNPSSSAPGR